MMEAWHPTHHITSSPLGDVMDGSDGFRKLRRSNRQARIRTRKRQFGSRALTFAEIQAIVSRYPLRAEHWRVLIPGTIIGRWTVLAFRERRFKRGIPYYDCVCICGKKRPVNAYDLLKGASKSCGCGPRPGAQVPRPNARRFVDLTGQTFNGIQATAFAGYSSDGYRLWRVKCLRCGSTAKVMRSSVLRKKGGPKSCGCWAADHNRRRMQTLFKVEKLLGARAFAGLASANLSDLMTMTKYANGTNGTPIPPPALP
jgi:hypothetical protein